MNKIINFEINQTIPSKEAILACQGITNINLASDKIISLMERALLLYLGIAEPKAILLEISKKKFDSLYKGEGLNEEITPIENIYKKANHLCLFASTIGSAISNKIEQLFNDNDYAIGSMLDSVASAAADKTAELAENFYYNYLLESGKITSNLVALRYSPGYCGWHITAQKKLFQTLKPERIGIKLRESFLMEPLKSVSGVIIVGKPEIHKIEKKYSFCKICKSPSCIDRYKTLSKINSRELKNV
jgi:hypothetical protein